ncbi:ATP-binding protein [Nocardioides sp. MAHUQ-72]|uniref:ATP-binding protein n=1 Tax=unclassified Nocardioides TaxID=2615069 RepID=UPI00360F5A8C
MHRSFDPHPSSVGDARRQVRELLTGAGRDDLLEAAELVVTEVVTNALVHAGTRIDVATALGETGLRVEVSDGSDQLPTVRHNDALAGTGRGLRLLQSTVDRWGVDSHDAGKTVWFELAAGAGEGELTTYDGDGLGELQVLSRRDERGMVCVELRNVPLLLHVAWHQHAEALLREYLLASLGDETDLDGLQAHAASSEAISLLLDHLPDPGVGEDPDQVMATAVEPGVSSEREVLAVPLDALAHFRVLDETLDAALALADSGEFLNPPTQPEIRAFRRWVCEEVERQSRGGQPLPWVDQSEAAPPPVRTPLDWAGEQVSRSGEAVIAADDTNGIVAVSKPALAMLGYADEAELVGRRLLWIIPSRFRQAHLAGFTMHLATGRAPLLGQPVSVPALRSDGTETVVELTVESRSLAGGRHVFVATLRP